MSIVGSFAFTHQIDFWISVGLLAAVYGIVSLGIQITAGTAGILNFAPAGFMAIGVYTMAILTVDESVPLWVAMICGAFSSAAAALLIGVVALRLRGDYFAIVTLAFAEIVGYLAINETGLTHGDQGIFGFSSAWIPISTSISRWLDSIGIHASYLLPLLLVSWAVFLMLTVVLIWLARTPWGRVLRAIRDDEDAARALGKNTLAYKLQALAICAVLCAIAGYVLALDLALVLPTMFTSDVTIFAFAIVVLAGVDNFLGVLGASLVFLIVLEGSLYVDLPLSPSKVASLRFIIAGVVLVVATAVRTGLWGPHFRSIRRG